MIRSINKASLFLLLTCLFIFMTGFASNGWAQDAYGTAADQIDKANEAIKDFAKDPSFGGGVGAVGESVGAGLSTVAAPIVKLLSDAASAFTRILMQYIGTSGASFCWFCPMFGGLFDGMNNLATAISVKLANTFLMLMGVGLLFSIAFKVGKMVTQLQAVDLMQFLNDMFKHLGRAIIATALLVSSLSIFAFVVSPILSLSLNLSNVIMDEGGGRGQVIRAMQDSGIQITGICDDLKADMENIQSVETQTKAFTPDVRASLICSLRTMSAGLIFGLAVGACVYALTWTDMVWNVLPNVQYAILGLLLILGHLAIMISFPFKLIDAMIRLAFVCALMPLWIILWVFPATVGYTKKAWDMFISSCLIFVCLSVVITLVMSLMSASIPNKEALIKALMAGRDIEAARMLPIGGKDLFVSLALCFIGWKMLGTATTLASSFVGSIPDLGVGQGMASTTIAAGKAAQPYVAAGAKKGMDKLGFDAGKRQTATNWLMRGGAFLATGGLSAVGELAYRAIFGKKSAPKAKFKDTKEEEK